ncbi:MAG: hypothetical protein H7Z21_02580, partial [Hymenobacter sp.]|nr:hypothetical protein [Hymenobacter sp.]
MARLVFWRLARTMLAVWALASAVFLVSHCDADAAARFGLPDPADALAGRHATPAAQLASQQAALQRLGLDLPVFYVSRDAGLGAGHWHWHGRHNQYHRWAAALLRGDLGTS